MPVDREARRASPAAVQYDDSAFIGEIRIFPYATVPNGWLSCDGQSLAIASYPDLFLVVGTLYGGDGVTSFNLPDLRGRVPIGPGQGAGLTNRSVGESGGAETETLAIAEMPSHTHGFRASSGNGASDRPGGSVFGRDPAAIPEFGTVADASLGSAAVASAGGGQPHNNMQAFLTVTYLIAYQGMTPTP
jgi:microcystin-dependent protein